jgi:anti-sigma B factor antagonist
LAVLRIEELQIGDVTVLKLEGTVTTGEGNVVLRSAVRRVLEEGKRKIVLDYGGVARDDSSGRGELIASYTAVTRAGGRFVICNPTWTIREGLTITKLLTVFDTYDSVEDAVAALSGGGVFASCPVDSVPFLVAASGSPIPASVACPRCGTLCTLKPGTAVDYGMPSAVAYKVVSFSIQTYEGEAVVVELGNPSVMEVVGRLDLFSFGVVEKAWYAIPWPRRVIFHLSRRSEVSAPGAAALLEFCHQEGYGGRAVILRTGRRPALRELLPAGHPVYASREAALKALAETPA